MLIDLEFCVGCYACQTACQDYYELSVEETYLRCFGMKEHKCDIVDGNEMMFLAPYPYDLEKCAYCFEQEGGIAPCTPQCMAKAIHVDEIDKLRELADKSKWRTLIYQ
jgi:Fe-S-cluster-containing dehydrogenase component